MAGGMERYYQVARCFRDEDLRSDRQPEFTQLDIEMSFIKEGDIQDIIERLIAHVWKIALNKEVKTPFRRMTYNEAFSTYGSDKPDLRFALPIVDVTQLFARTELSFLRTILDNQGKVGALCVHKEFTRSELDNWVNKAQKLEAKGLLWIRMKEDGSLDSPVAKFLPSDFLANLKNLIPDFGTGSTLFIVAGKQTQAWTVLGRLRLELGKELNMINQDEFNFLWVIDFPLFEQDETTKQWNAVHHPFTSPQEGWQSLEPSQMKARAYDVVLNGVELGGGSIRIHDAQVQDKVFDLLGLSKEQVKNKFGFLLEAQELGFPPHGGIALGLDRLIMLMCQATSIREVIAFPKTQRGYDPLMEAPAEVQAEQIREYGLLFAPSKKE
jgi:aspartyl-tRNA synthetase